MALSPPLSPVLAPETGPFRLDRPARQTVPFAFASPHSGRCYPASLLERSRLDATALRRSEDAFVDELFAGAVGLGAPLLSAHFPRAFLDVNRGIAELDVGMFDGALGVPVDAPSPRVAAGLGGIPRIVRDGAEIYRGKLDRAEADARLSQLYKPYHRALAALMEETRARFGVAVLIDCHSMPSALSVPDVVLGDRYGASAAPALTARAEAAFARASSIRYDLETVNGRIEGDIDLAVEGKHGPKEARGSYNGGSESLRCETVNGSIRLKTN